MHKTNNTEWIDPAYGLNDDQVKERIDAGYILSLIHI